MRQCLPLRIWRHLQRPSILYTPCISARNATRFGVIVVSPSKSADTTVQTVYSKSPRQAFVQRETGMCQRFCEAVVKSDQRRRCARNCFQGPHCRNTLSVVHSDPPDDSLLRSTSSQAGAMGEPPFLLYCNNCRWDSAEVGITFEKPTGLARKNLVELPIIPS